MGHLYAEAAVLVPPGIEEFGIVVVEAEAAGRPLIAMDAGRACVTVVLTTVTDLAG